MLSIAFYLFSSLLLLGALGVVFSRHAVHGVLWLIFCFFNAAGLFILLNAEFLAMLLVIVYVGAVAVLFLFVVMMLAIKPSKKKPLPFKTRVFHLLWGVRDLSWFLAFWIPLSLLTSYGFLWAWTWISAVAIMPHFQGPWSMVHYSSLGAGMTLSTVALMTFLKQRLKSGLGYLGSSVPFTVLIGGVLLVELFFLASLWTVSPHAEQSISAPVPPHDLMTNAQALASLIYQYYVYIFQACGLILLVAMVGAIALAYRDQRSSKHQDIARQNARDPKKTLIMKNPQSYEGCPDV